MFFRRGASHLSGATDCTDGSHEFSDEHFEVDRDDISLSGRAPAPVTLSARAIHC